VINPIKADSIAFVVIVAAMGLTGWLLLVLFPASGG
jgi:hypothetical protein